jgi:hypothetical protein
MEKLSKYSNPEIAQKNAIKYLGKDAKLFKSNNKNKKYMVYDKNKNKWISFGQMGYEDFTKHQDLTRRKNYLNRSKNIKGNWESDKYSPNNLSRNILW